jgi:hypothetical protein
MTVHKLHHEEYNEVDYQLIAIHTSLEDYRLAYYINQNLPIILSKSNCNIQISTKNGETQFTRFMFDDEKTGVCWDLIQNKNDIQLSPQRVNEGLFAETNSKFSTKAYLIPEFKKVDYFLKIDNSAEIIDVAQIAGLINKIERISTVYSVDVENIKSKNNLIF